MAGILFTATHPLQSPRRRARAPSASRWRTQRRWSDIDIALAGGGREDGTEPTPATRTRGRQREGAWHPAARLRGARTREPATRKRGARAQTPARRHVRRCRSPCERGGTRREGRRCPATVGKLLLGHWSP
eukprot:gene3314-biopygen12739